MASLNANRPSLGRLCKLLSAKRRAETGDLLATLPMQVSRIASDASATGAQARARVAALSS